MRTGDFKQTYGELVTLVDSPRYGCGRWCWSRALIAHPLLLNSYALSFLMIVLITAVGALGLNILTGYTGLISLGHVGFLVTGATPMRCWFRNIHAPADWLPRRGRGAARPSSLSARRRWRLKGLYLAITTLAFSFIINTVILEARWLTNGARWHFDTTARDFGLSFDSDAAFTYLCLGFAHPHAVCHAQHPPQPCRPRLCRDPRQRYRRPRHGHQFARLQAVRLRHLGLHHRSVGGVVRALFVFR